MCIRDRGKPVKIDGGEETLLRSCEYFDVHKIKVSGTVTLDADEKLSLIHIFAKFIICQLSTVTQSLNSLQIVYDRHYNISGGASCIAVSYTHLDVYKRQHRVCSCLIFPADAGLTRC